MNDVLPAIKMGSVPVEGTADVTCFRFYNALHGS
jgi:hypothetical protein